jgi:hypothetical protein
MLDLEDKLGRTPLLLATSNGNTKVENLLYAKTMSFKDCELAAGEGGFYTDHERAKGDTPSLWCQVTKYIEM